jgi:phosphomethylpyrimidine synthase
MSDFPASTRVYVPGKLNPSLRVPFRDISLKDNTSMRVYDTRGPWGDPESTCDVRMGLSPLRESWILERNDTEEYAGRNVKPEDNGFLSDKHAEQSAGKHRLEPYPGVRRRPRRARSGGAAT